MNPMATRSLGPAEAVEDAEVMARISVMDRLTADRATPTIRAMATASRYAGAALRVAAASWAFVLPVAPYIAVKGAPGSPAHAFSALMFAIGSFVCHQRPERSFALWGTQLPVCARCTGIYLGAACVALLYRARSATGRLAAPLPFLVAAAVPTLMTLALEWLTPIAPSNVVRAAAGTLLGAAVLVVLLDELRLEGVR